MNRYLANSFDSRDADNPATYARLPLLLTAALIVGCSSGGDNGAVPAAATPDPAPAPAPPPPPPPSTDPLDIELRALITTLGLTGAPATGRQLPAIEAPIPQLGKQLFFSKSLGGGFDSACVSCHHNVVSEFSQARHHPVSDKGAACEQCHQPHSAVSLRGSKGFPANCNDCHTEKAGPYLYPHDVSIVDGCQSCHRVHGTTSRHLLNADRQANLCYQCHSGATTPPWHSAPRFLTEKCSACHTAIHGSNTNPFFLEE